jgi:hypothetical protein
VNSDSGLGQFAFHIPPESLFTSLLFVLLSSSRRSRGYFGSTSEVEDYHVSLDDVSVLELAIQPDIKHHAAPATLAMWRLA